jgi:hypothetical protein
MAMDYVPITGTLLQKKKVAGVQIRYVLVKVSLSANASLY